MRRGGRILPRAPAVPRPEIMFAFWLQPGDVAPVEKIHDADSCCIGYRMVGLGGKSSDELPLDPEVKYGGVVRASRRQLPRRGAR